MRSKILISIIALTCLLITGYFAYRLYLPKYIASIIVEEKNTSYLPEEIAKKINKIRIPVNETTEMIILSFEKSGIKTEDLLQEIEKVNEDQVNNFIDELINEEHNNDPNKIFDLGKKHFPTSFDVEILREDFLREATPQLIKKAIKLARSYKNEDYINFESGKMIAKQIFHQKKNELKSKNLIY